MVGNRWSGKALMVVLLVALLMSVVPMATLSFDVSDEVQVTDTTDAEQLPRVAYDASGNVHVIYVVTGTDWSLKWMKLDPDGDRLAGPVDVTPSGTTGTITSHAMAVDGSGRVHVALSATAGSDTSNEIYYAQLSSTGTVTVSPRRINVTDPASFDVDIAADASGNAYLVWTEGGSPNTLWWAKVSPSGSVAVTPRRINPVPGFGGQVENARIGVDGSGYSSIVFRVKSNQLARYTLHFMRLTPQGNVDVDPMQVASSTATDIVTPHVDMDGVGRLHVTYAVSNGATTKQIHLILLDSEGGTDYSGQIASAPVGEAFNPDVAATAAGDSWCIYSTADNPLTAPAVVHAYHRYDSNGTTEALVASDPDLSSGPARIAGDGDSATVMFARSGDLFLVSLTYPAQSNRAPTASLTVRPTSAQVGETVTFDGSASSDPDSGDHVGSWYFEWGDGGSSGWVAQSSMTHVYSAVGTYTGRLRVRDTHGAESGTAEVVVTITSASANQAPTARLSANPVSVNVGSEVLFDGTSSSDTDGTVAQYLYSFGDGTTEGWTTSSQVTHAFTAAGVYTASLQVKDDKGKTSTNKAEVQVEVEQPNEPPVAEIVSVLPNPAMQGDPVTFTGVGTDPDGVVTQYVWDSNLLPMLSDQATFTTSTLEVGIHTITFKVRDDDGVWSEPDTVTLEVKRNNPPTLTVLTTKTEADTETVIEFLVRYTDPEGDAPTSARLYYGREQPYFQEVLLQADETDTNVKDGKEYYFNMKLKDPGNYTYYFEFVNEKNGKRLSDARHINVKEATGFLPGPGAAAAAGAMLLAVAMAAGHQRGRGMPKSARKGSAGWAPEPSKTVR
jgi:PKD repeat protein